MNTYHATPYDISATGFYFQTLEEYQKKAAEHRNEYGDPVEEYEIQYIDGEGGDCDLFHTLSVNQANLNIWFDDFEGAFTDEELVKVLYLSGEFGLSMKEILERDLDDVYLFEGSPKDYAERYLEDSGILDAVEKAGLNPFYIDTDAYARDMEINGGFTTFEHDGNQFVIEYHG